MQAPQLTHSSARSCTSTRAAPPSTVRALTQLSGTALPQISRIRSSNRARRCGPSITARWGGDRGDPWWQPGPGSARSPPPPPPPSTRNPRWRGLPNPPPPDQQQQGQQGQQPTKPQLRNTARRLYRNERLRKLVEQDVEEQHRGRWGPDPNAAAAEAEEQEEEDAYNAPMPVQGPLQPPSWFDMVSGNKEARKVMEWVQQQREQRRRQQEQQLDDQVGVLAVVYALVALAIGVVGLVAAS